MTNPYGGTNDGYCGCPTGLYDSPRLVDSHDHTSTYYCTYRRINSAPVANANGPYVGNEGSPIAFDPSSSYDPDGSIVLYEWDFDSDGAYDASTTSPTAAISTWGDDHTGTVKLRVTDNGGLSGTDTASVRVDNVNPVVDAGTDQTVDEGDLVTIGPTFTDAGSADTHTATIDWGDGSTATNIDPAISPLSYTHTYADNGAYTVTLRVTDDDGGEGTDTLTVTVNNVAPTVDAGTDQTVDEGDTVSLDPSQFNDMGTHDSHTATIDWGDGTAVEPGSVSESPFGPPGNTAGADGTVYGSHVYADNGAYTVTLRVTDDDGGEGTDTLTVTVNNVAPTVDAGTDQTVDEGDTVSLDPSQFNDMGTHDSHTATIDWGDGTAVEPGSVSESPFGPPGNTAGADGTVYGSHVYADNGAYTVTLRVTDDDGGEGTDTLTVTVNNVAPTVGDIYAPIDPVSVGTVVSASAGFTDPGTLDTHTAVWDWGDGTSPGTVDETDGSGTVSGSNTYTTPGVYTIKLTVTDDDGGSGESLYQYMVIYDPTGGFVTGGGWIYSEAGAYVPDPDAEGKANFGFVSKYKKGQETPTGNTEFQFKAGDLNFHSDSYDWLVIAGHKAMYKGTGTINGVGNYGFLLSAIDEKLTPSTAVDMFRIKIWDKDDGDIVVYDNQMKALNDADPTTEIAGGQIVIHKAK